MIRIELTNDQFYDLYKHNEFVRNFTREAVYAILDNISERQEESPDSVIDWTEVFMNADEHTPESLIMQHYNKYSGDETEAIYDAYDSDDSDNADEILRDNLAEYINSQMSGIKLDKTFLIIN